MSLHLLFRRENYGWLQYIPLTVNSVREFKLKQLSVIPSRRGVGIFCGFGLRVPMCTPVLASSPKEL